MKVSGMSIFNRPLQNPYCLSDSINEMMSISAFLTQRSGLCRRITDPTTGYLTKRKETDLNTYELVIPNREIRMTAWCA